MTPNEIEAITRGIAKPIAEFVKSEIAAADRSIHQRLDAIEAALNIAPEELAKAVRNEQ